MQYEMLNDILEIAAIQKCSNSIIQMKTMLEDAQGWRKLTTKEKRVLNALETIIKGEAQRLERSKRIKYKGPIGGELPMPPI